MEFLSDFGPLVTEVDKAREISCVEAVVLLNTIAVRRIRSNNWERVT